MTDHRDPVTDALRAIAALAEWLEIELVAATPEPGRSSGKPASRPPVNLDIVSDLDETWNCLTTWARDWAETFSYTPPASPTWPTLTDWLATHWPRVRDEHPAAQDFADELTHRHRPDCPPTCRQGWLHALNRHRDTQRRWQRLPGRWTCPTTTDEGTSCGGILLEHVIKRVIECRRCQATWAGDAEYARLGLLIGVEPLVTLEQAAALQSVSVRSVQRWIARGWLPSQLRDGTVVVDRLDLALVKDRAQG